MARSAAVAARDGQPIRRRIEPEYRLRVLRTETLTPHLVRVVFGGPGLEEFSDNGYADRCVKLAFPRPGVEHLWPLAVAEIRATMPRSMWPMVRTYTIRALDHAAGELTLDFVVHGSAGVAGPWATNARPGDEVVMLGPGGSYSPADDVDAHVMIGDESVLPAIAVACERVKPEVPVHVFAEVDGPADEIDLHTLGDLTVHWIHRDSGGDLVAAVRAAAWPTGRVQAFVHGETTAVRALRPHVLGERGVAPSLLSISGYWRRGAEADVFQAEKQAELLGDGSRPA
ncbi:siderophore-interacting protein [Actinomycetospora sp.]|jgi:NADPH-dependent ferric siderophore reductase|uniref:siderophore-interacting protein n=1 Tax=Actinomycetospora sp. TaxID=1872135 RepID=UPI002F4258D9